MSSSLLERMKSVMESNNVTPKQLTTEFGISNSSFTDWGKGKGIPSISFLSRFAERFEVSLDYLVFGKCELCAPVLENSNSEDKELLDRFHSLPAEYRARILGYMDGMLTVLQNEQLAEAE